MTGSSHQPARARRTAGRDGPHPVDVHAGARLRQLRTLRGLSQEALGERIGLTFQQIQKYERGANRMGASRLWQIATVLGVDPAWFFEGLDASGQPTPPKVGTREHLELIRDFDRCDRQAQARIRDLVRVIAKAQAEAVARAEQPPAGGVREPRDDAAPQAAE